MPRTSKKGKKSSGASSKAAASSSGANGDSSSVGAGQNEVAVNDEAGEKTASASPSEQTRVMGVRMSGVKHSGLLAKNGKGR